MTSIVGTPLDMTRGTIQPGACRIDIADAHGNPFYTITLPDDGQARAVAHTYLAGNGYENDDCLVMVQELFEQASLTCLSSYNEAITYHVTYLPLG